MKQIWKFKVMGVIEMPKGAEILTVKVQDLNNVCIWTKVDPEMETESRMFVVIGTGHSFDDTNKEYIGTYLDGPFVWHLFEIKK
jgi:hypothetical protein